MAVYIPGVGRMYNKPKDEEEYSSSGPVESRTMWDSGELPTNYTPVLQREEYQKKSFLGDLWDKYIEISDFEGRGLASALTLGLIPARDASTAKYISPTTANVANVSSMIGGSVLPIGGLYNLAGKGMAKLPQATSLVGKLGQTALKGGAAVGAYEGIHSGADSAWQGNDLSTIGMDAAKGFGEGFLWGAGGDVALKGLGMGYNAIRNGNQMNTLRNLNLSKDPLGLPAPAETLALPSPKTNLLPGDVIYPQPGRVGMQDALPMTQGEQMARQALNNDTRLLTGTVDNSIKPNAPAERLELPMTGEESLTRQYADQLGLEYPLNTQGKAQVEFTRATEDLAKQTGGYLDTPYAKQVEDAKTILNDYQAQRQSILDGMAEYMAKTDKAASSEPDIFTQIRKRGGIRPDKADLQGEFKYDIPPSVKSKNGLPLDEMAAELGIEQRQLINILSQGRAKGKNFTKDAEYFLQGDKEFQALESKIAEQQAYLDELIKNKPADGGTETFWDVAKQQAAQQGKDLDDLYKTATDAEHARWKDVVGLGEPTPGKYPTRQPAEPTAELENARNILRKPINVETAEKIFSVFPQLKAEFKPLAKRVERAQAYRAKQQAKLTQPAQKATVPPQSVDVNRQIAIDLLSKNPAPAKAQAILRAYPDLVSYYKPPKVKGQNVASMAENMAQPNKVMAENIQQPNGQVMAEKIETPPDEYNLTIELPNVADDVPKALEGINVAELKDTKGTLYNHKDFDRNFRDVFKGGYEKVKKAILDPFDKAKGKKVDFERKILSDLKENVVEKLGIKPGSRLSALVQKYGEGEINFYQLKEMTPKWKQVIKADKWFRQEYDRIIDQVNEVRRQIYPNNPDKLIPKRKDYYRHFKEFADGFEGLKNIFDSPANIDPHLAGKSDFTLPKSKWASPWQKRTGNETDYDAVGGFLNYLPSASYAIHIDPHIPRFERLADELAGATESTKQLNGFIEWLRDFSRDLAGKTNHIDRTVIKYVPGSRKALQVLTWANNKIKGNVILGKVGSMLAQTANIPNGIAFAKQHSAAGAGRALASIFKKDAPIYQSDFIKERFGSKMYREFDTTWIEGLVGSKLPGNVDNLVSPGKVKDFTVWMMETADRIGTSFVWNAAYSKGLAQKVADPIKFADNSTRRLVAGRGIGEVPLVQKSKVFQLVAPFQLEVANLWHVMGDFVKTKDFGGLATLFVANHMFNEVMKQTRGSAVVFDPIQAMMDAFGEDDLTTVERAGRIGGEVLSNVPLGQTIAATLVDNEWNRKKIFGRQDPTRFGSGLLLQRGLEDPVTKLLLPFGGDQLRKTYQGAKAMQDGGVYTKDGDQLMYHIDPTTGNQVKSLLFGPTATPEAQEYFKQDRIPLTEKMTETYKKNPTKGNYENIQTERRINYIDSQISDLIKEQKKEGITKERTEQIKKLREQRAELARKKRGA